MLTPAGLTNILENYAQIVEEKDPTTGKKKRKQVWPRYHQLGVVRQALADVRAHGAGKRYLIQHSAGSGKSNSIAWLAHQLIGLKRDDKEVFDSVIVVTDRRILDDQIQKTIKQFMQVGATVGHAEHSGDLRKFIEEGKKIIVSTVQKFPFILDEIATEGGKTFAIVIDEAHSSQGGKTSAAMSEALSVPAEDEDDGTDPEDTVNEALEKRMAARKMLTNASYFAFTATPKNKTLEMFGEPLPPDAEGKVKHRPFHSYTMKQAIEEGFILDVLKSYTPVDSYYKLVKKIEDDPEFDTKKAQKKLRRYVESHDHAIRLKAEIMVDHFHEQVMAAGKIGGQARAMVVTQRHRAGHPVLPRLQGVSRGAQEPVPGDRRLLRRARVRRREGQRGFAERLFQRRHRRQDPGRPVPLPDLRRQVPDRLRRAAAAHDVRGQAALGHQGRADACRASTARTRRSTTASCSTSRTTARRSPSPSRTTTAPRCSREETDPNKLHDLKAALDDAQVYSPEQVQQVVELFLGGADRDKLDPILDACVAVYMDRLDEDGQVDFKGKAKVFCRTYEFPLVGDPVHATRSGRSSRSSSTC